MHRQPDATRLDLPPAAKIGIAIAALILALVAALEAGGGDLVPVSPRPPASVTVQSSERPPASAAPAAGHGVHFHWTNTTSRPGSDGKIYGYRWPCTGSRCTIPRYPARVIQTQPATPSIDYQAIYRQMLERMAADPRFRGPAGPAGPAGGIGTTPVIDYEKLAAKLAPLMPAPQVTAPRINYELLAAEVIKRLPPIRFELFDLDGRKIGETLEYPNNGEPIPWLLRSLEP